MARYKDYCYEQNKMIPILFREQILPGTFEYTLNHLIDHEEASHPNITITSHPLETP